MGMNELLGRDAKVGDDSSGAVDRDDWSRRAEFNMTPLRWVRLRLPV